MVKTMAKARYGRKMPISKEKFKAEMKKRNLTYDDLAEATGFTRGGVSGCVSEGYVNPVMAKIYEYEFNMPYSLYELTDEPKEEEKTEPAPSVTTPNAINVSGDELYKIIYSAVLSAIKMSKGGTPHN